MDVKKNVLLLMVACSFLVFSACRSECYEETSGNAIEGIPILQEENDFGIDATEIVSEGNGSSKEENQSMEAFSGDEHEEIHTLEELFRLTDDAWSEKKEYQEAVKAYDEAVGTNTVEWIKENMHYGIGDARFLVGYVDEDDIPELFLCYGTVHINGVHIFTYLPDAKKVVRVGHFSSFGGVTYSHKKNRILSQYGNHGFYVHYVTAIKNGQPELVDVAISDGGSRHDDVVGFYGFTVPKGVDGSREGFDKIGLSDLEVPLEYPEDEYLISDEEEGRIIMELMGNPQNDEVKYAYYDGMYVVAPSKEGIIIK